MLTTSHCLNFCSFLLNGKGVERRTNVFMVCEVLLVFDMIEKSDAGARKL